jgi:hypothetical protein
MPIVFVHGVKTRPGSSWERQAAARRSLFSRYALRGLAEPADVSYAEPMWGDRGAAPRWNHASLPSSSIESFDLDADHDDQVAAAIVDARFDLDTAVLPDERLLAPTRAAVAEGREPSDRQPLEDLLDVICVTAADDPDDIDPDALAELSVRAVDYARHNPSPDWLADVSDDVELVNTFFREVEQWPLQHGSAELTEPIDIEEFGIGDVIERLSEKAGRISGVGGLLGGRAITAAGRGAAHRAGAIFIGDVLVYLNCRGNKDHPGEIVQRVASALDDARGAIDAERDPKLVVVGHSMGGNILYDLLTYFRPDIEVDVLVTVGSQVALFEELKQFRVSDDTVPTDPTTDRVQAPQNVGRWINVFDLNDWLGFAAEGVFAGVEDFKYSTGEGALKAHGAYLMLPSFHDRLRARLMERW